jgi:hypothetical protein
MALAAKVTSCVRPVEPVGTRGDLSDCLKLAMQRLGIEVKEVAYVWGCDHSYVSRVLAGEKVLTDVKIAQLPDELQDAMVDAWAEQRGRLVGSRAAAARSIEGIAALLLLDVPIRMAKAGVK